MPGTKPKFEIVEGAQLPVMSFVMDDVQESDFDSIGLAVRRSDGKLLNKVAVVTDPGDPPNKVPLSFEFQWAVGDIIAGTHAADLQMFVAGELLSIPTARAIQIIARKKA